MKSSHFFLPVCASVALGQSQFPIFGNTTNNTCGDSILSPANATGLQNVSGYDYWNNGLGQWKVAVSTKFSAATIQSNPDLTEASPGAVANVWLDPFLGVDLTNGNNAFSACAFIFKDLPYNTKLRGQNDDTSCRQTLSQQCIDAIEWRAAETAKWLVMNPTRGPFSNLTPPILAPICSDIIAGVGAGPATGADAGFNPFPSECVPFFDNGDSHYPGALDTLILTSNVTGPQNCTFRRGYNSAHVKGGTSYNVPPGLTYPFNSTNKTASASYDELVQQVWPILTVVFPPANVSRPASVVSNAFMTCIRAGTVKVGSRIPAALPAATPVRFPGRPLSSGAIAGVVIGSVLGAGILIGAIWWIWRGRRRRSTRAIQGTTEGSRAVSPTHTDKEKVHQLDSKEGPSQLDGLQRIELGRGDVRSELAAGSPVAPQELPGSNPTDVSSTKVRYDT